MRSISSRLRLSFGLLMVMAVVMAAVVLFAARLTAQADAERDAALMELQDTTRLLAQINASRLLISEFVHTGTGASRDVALNSLSELTKLQTGGEGARELATDAWRKAQNAVDAIVNASDAALVIQDNVAALPNATVALAEAVGAVQSHSVSQVVAMMTIIGRLRLAVEGSIAQADTHAPARVVTELGKLESLLQDWSGPRTERTELLLRSLSRGVEEIRTQQRQLMNAGDQKAQAVGAFLKALEALRNHARLREEQADKRFGEASLHAQEVADRVNVTVLWVLAAILVAGMLMARRLGMAIAVPILDLDQSMQRIASGQLDHAVPGIDRQDEVGTMARTVVHFREVQVRERGLQERERLAQAELREHQERQLQEIESQVAQRTHDLSEALAHNQRVSVDLEAARQTAEKANRAKGEFLARMSHEIRTPLNAVIGMSHLLTGSGLNARQQEYVRSTMGAAQSLMRVLSDVLDFSSLEARQLTVQPVPFQLETVFDRLGSVVALQADERNIEVLFHFQPDVPSQWNADAMRLGQILVNLVSNGVKFSDSGTVMVAVSVAADNGLLFEVSDQGHGIEAERLSSMFHAFQQADSSLTRREGGLGLGLTICKELSELMGGHLSVFSQPGKGSVFSLQLPGKLNGSSTAFPKLPTLLNGREVLVVDDNPLVRQILGDQLRAHGLLVMAVDSAEEAQHVLRKRSAEHQPLPEVVLLDLRMSGLGGLEVADGWRRSLGRLAPAVILMDGSLGLASLRAQAERIGIVGFLPKPWVPSLLRQELVRAFGMSLGHHALEVGEVADVSSALASRAGARILLVDDTRINRMIARALLQQVGMVVDEAENGAVALDMLARQSYDLVLMDIQMPVMDGLEATRKLRMQPQWADVPVVALTAHASAEDRSLSLSAGMNDHLTKPVNPGELHDVLRRWIAPVVSAENGARDATPVEGAASMEVTESETVQLNEAVTDQIDVIGGLRTVGGSKTLLLRLLHELTHTYGQEPQAMLAQLQAGDFAGVGKAAHRLYGAAVSVGANRISDAARTVSQRIRDGRLDTVRQVIGELDHALGDLRGALGAESPSLRYASAVVVADAEAMFSALDASLIEGNARAELELAALSQRFRTEELDWEPLRDAIEQVDFDQARRLLSNMKRLLGRERA